MEVLKQNAIGWLQSMFVSRKTVEHQLENILKASMGQIFIYCLSKMLKRINFFYLLSSENWQQA